MLKILREIKRRLFPSDDKPKPLPPIATTPDISNSTFLFLGGLHRSGTSILHRLMREHPDTSGFSNTHAPEDEGQHLQSVFPVARVYGGPGIFGFNPNSHMNETSDLICTENRNTILKEWGAYYNLDKKILLEKSPPNLVRSRFLQAMFPNSIHIFIIRHPVANSVATQKWSKTTLTELILHWYICHLTLLNDTNHLRTFLVFRYEDFVSSPDFFFRKICNLSDLPEFTPKEAVVDHNNKYFKKWLPEHAAEKDMIANLFPDVTNFFENLGYLLTEPYVLPPAKGIITIPEE